MPLRVFDFFEAPDRHGAIDMREDALQNDDSTLIKLLINSFTFDLHSSNSILHPIIEHRRKVEKI